MDCFNHLCPFRQNTTTNYNNCECLSCQLRCDGTFGYSADCYILTADETAKIADNPNHGVGTECQEVEK